MKKISFVIPCYRSEQTIGHVVAEIDGKMQEMKDFEYEIVLVNDCSPDHTKNALWDLCQEKSEGNGVRRAISFAKNFGQHSASRLLGRLRGMFG